MHVLVLCSASPLQEDTCDSVANVFNILPDTLLENNPGLNCSTLAPGQQLCINIGEPQDYICEEYYQIQPGDTCEYVYRYIIQPPLSPALFYAYNPGIICSNLVPLLSKNASATDVSAASTLPGPEVGKANTPLTSELPHVLHCSSFVLEFLVL